MRPRRTRSFREALLFHGAIPSPRYVPIRTPRRPRHRFEADRLPDSVERGVAPDFPAGVGRETAIQRTGPVGWRIGVQAAIGKARQLRLRRAHIPELLVIETYPFERQPKLNKKKLFALCDSLGYVKQNQNILWLGGTGCGKAGLATSFLIQAIDQGYSGGYVLFAELVNELYQSVADHTKAQVLKKYSPGKFY